MGSPYGLNIQTLSDGAANINFYNLDSDYYTPIFSGCNRGILGKIKSSYVITVVDPGVYYMQEPRFKNMYAATPSIDYRTNTPMYETFIVKAGEVVYIGTPNVITGKDKIICLWEDRFREARNFLKQRHPELAPKLEKRGLYTNIKGKLKKKPLLQRNEIEPAALIIKKYLAK